MKNKDWVILVTAVSDSKPLEPVQLQKALFLLGRCLTKQQLKVDKFYQFDPYDYGPFCRQIYQDAESLCKEGLINIEQHDFLPYKLYSATSSGKEAAKCLKATLDDKISKYLGQAVRWVTSLTFKQLVTWIYTKFPDMKVNSIFQA